MAWEPDYIAVADAADWLGINDSFDDTKLALAISAASRTVDEECSGAVTRQFGNTTFAQTRSYRTWYHFERRRWVAVLDDLTTISGISISGDGVAVTDYTLEPADAPLNGRPYEWIELASSACTVSVSGVWGWSAVPKNVKQATLLETARIFTRKNAPFGIAGSPDQGSEMRLLARIDPDAAFLLKRYKRAGGKG